MSDNLSVVTENQPIRCLIVDDELVAIKVIINNIEKLNFLKVAATCSSAIDAAEVLKKQEIDLMFLDINVPNLSGLEFLESLENPPLTILTTAYSEYALDGFRLHVEDYLLKPFSFQRFFRAIQKAKELFESRIFLQKNEEEKTTDIYIRQGDSFQRIKWDEIIFVEAMQNYLKLHLAGKNYIIHQTMTSLEEMLSKDTFFRIHKSYLVNTSYIDTISGGRLFINGKELPISKLRREELLIKVVLKKLISK
ncbi:MAG: LytTR family DNA-binding domain-containing protein [Odoribacter sp.]|nr:LytTR family DNA-binding domain-containing protein [Odoribacter sp.]